MKGKLHFVVGLLKNLFNPRISNFALVSANVQVDKTAYINRFVKAEFCSIADHCRIGM